MNNHKSSHFVFSLSLLLIFVIGSFFVLLFETKSYSLIQNSIHQQESIYMPLSYLQTKCKMNDHLSIATIEQHECLVFQQDHMKTYIYFDEGKLKELYASDEYDVSLSQGTDLFEIDDFQINLTPSMLMIVIEKDDMRKEFNIHLFKEVMME